MNTPATGVTGKLVSTIQQAWNSMGNGNLGSLAEIYSADIEFEDPISQGRGIGNLERHFGRLFRNLTRTSYTYGRSTWTADTLVMEWTLRAEIRSTGKELAFPGISWLQLEPETGKIVKSREYFDLGNALYEQVPVLGYFIRRIRQRLQVHGGDRPKHRKG